MAEARHQLAERLEGRLRYLSARLEHLQRDADHLVPPRGRPHRPLDDLGPALDEVIDVSREELAQVQDALARMARGEYGRCTGCGEPLPLDHLRMLPHADTCRACAPRRGRDVLHWVRREHGWLELALATLRELMQALARDGRGAPPWDTEREEAAHRVLLVLLADFQRELDEHFAREEAGGYLADALAVAPRLARRAARLEGQHAELAREVDRIFRQARFAHPHSEAWRRLDAEFRTLARALQRHERAENQLVSEAFVTDVGSGD